MSSTKCARCEQTVYPVEGLRCLDKIWHKGCFKCQECSMTLNLKNYKGFEKKPYCNAHCPQAKATTVADTPEIRRLAENTRIQSQAKYHEDFEKSKGKGFTAIADDPETLRIKEASKIISNVAYHGELERKKQMEEKRSISGSDEVHVNNSNGSNIRQQQIKVQRGSAPQNQDISEISPHHIQQQHQQHQQQQIHQQIQQQKQHIQKQQKPHRNIQEQQLRQHNGQPIESHQLHHFSGSMQQQQQPPSSAKQYNPSSHNQQQEQQILMRQQQQMLQQQHHHQMMMMQQQQRQSIDPNMAGSRQLIKQSMNSNTSNNNHIRYQQTIQNHQLPQQMRYVPLNDSNPSQQAQLMGGLHMINPAQMGEVASNSQRVISNSALIGAQPQPQHNMIHNYNQINGAMQPKQHHYIPRQTIYPNQMQPINHQMLPHIQQQHNQQMQPVQLIQQMQSQVPKRVFRAIYDYVANDIDEVSFFENDILIDCVNVDGNWLIGKVARSGQTGMLPANYVVEFSK